MQNKIEEGNAKARELYMLLEMFIKNKYSRLRCAAPKLGQTAYAAIWQCWNEDVEDIKQTILAYNFKISMKSIERALLLINDIEEDMRYIKRTAEAGSGGIPPQEPDWDEEQWEEQGYSPHPSKSEQDKHAAFVRNIQIRLVDVFAQYPIRPQ